jgi:hypothetical protein
MCALPKGFIKNIKLIKDKVGFERRQEILDDIDNKGTYLPRGVAYKDMDTSFVDFIKSDMRLSLDGGETPVIFLTLQRWSEFSRTWQSSDEYKNIKMPFITIVRKPDIQIGQNQDGNWNVSSMSNIFTYIKVPTFEGGRKGIDVYKIPQPTAVDVNYEVRLFCNKMRNLNTFNTKVLKTFNARQKYINVKGHPMPLLLEGITDESNINDFEKRRFYVQNVDMLLSGYILDEDDYELIPTVNRLKVSESVEQPVSVKPIMRLDTIKDVKRINLSFIIKRSRGRFRFNLEFDTKFTDLHLENLGNLTFSIGGVIKTLPFIGNVGDTIDVTFNKENNKKESNFELGGEIL